MQAKIALGFVHAFIVASGLTLATTPALAQCQVDALRPLPPTQVLKWLCMSGGRLVVSGMGLSNGLQILVDQDGDWVEEAFLVLPDMGFDSGYGGLVVLLFPRPIVTLSRELAARPDAERRFLLGRAFDSIRGRYAPIMRLGPRERGEIGALLREAQLVKALDPTYNRKLRRPERLCGFAFDGKRLRLAGEDEIDAETLPLVYGVWRSRRAALQALRATADAHRLCLQVLGVEHALARPGPCFRYQIGRCAGVCAGKESIHAHHGRLAAALARHLAQSRARHRRPVRGCAGRVRRHGDRVRRRRTPRRFILAERGSRFEYAAYRHSARVGRVLRRRRSGRANGARALPGSSLTVGAATYSIARTR